MLSRRFEVAAGLACLLAAWLAAEEPKPVPSAQAAVPETVLKAFAKLPKEAQPVEWRVARNGALYALLPNGCELIVKEKRNAPVVAVQGWVRTGAMHEREFMGSGLSHYCEHLLFKGTVKRPTGQLDQEIRGGGGDNNAYTTSERTVYHVTTETPGWRNGFDCIADMLMNSTFPEAEVKKEHGVVTKEIERAQDNPEDRLWDAFARLVFQTHPYRVPVLGYPDRFAKVTREEVFAYYKRRYAPQMTTFIVVGDVDAAEALPLLARTVAGWPRINVDEVPIPEETEQVAPREVTLRHPLCQVPKCYMGFATVSLRNPDLYALDVLASVLGGGRSSRLYKQVKDKQDLVLQIDAWNWTPQYAGIFGISFNAPAGKIELARKAVATTIEGLIVLPPTDEELARAKRKVQADHVFNQMTAEGVAGALGSDWFVAGDLDFSETYVNGIAKVTSQDVVKVAEKYLRPGRMNVAVLLPGLDADGEKQPAEKPQATSHGDGMLGALKQIKFESGLRVFVREDKSLPVVHVALCLLGGQRWEPASQPGAANMLAEMLDHGTKSRTKLQLAEQIENLGASLSSFGGRNTCGLNLRCLKGDLPAAFELAADCLRNPVFSAEELAKVKAETLAAIEEEDESLFAIGGKLLRPKLFGAHPYGRPILGTKESVSKLESPDLGALHAAWLRPENIAITFVGDIYAVGAFKLVEKHFADLKPAAAFAPPENKLEPVPPEQMAETTKEGIEGAIVMLGFRGADLKHADREALDVIAALLSGLGGRLSVVVREKLGAAYAVGARNDSQLDGGSFVFYVQTDASSVEKLKDVYWAEIKKLRDEPVTEKELASIKSFLSGQEAIDMQDQAGLAQRLALAQLYDEGLEAVFGRRDKIAKVTAEQVQTAAKKYFDNKAWVLTVVKPAAEAPKAEKQQ